MNHQTTPFKCIVDYIGGFSRKDSQQAGGSFKWPRVQVSPPGQYARKFIEVG